MYKACVYLYYQTTINHNKIKKMSNQEKVQKLVSEVIESCKGTEWEEKTMTELRLKLKDLGLRDILIERLINN